ncbi:MAG: hypothetical protein JWN29_2513 [Acidimicrobiales bacterium]|nr:hypothetical protein [Acidimicrobiales bacterium]
MEAFVNVDERLGRVHGQHMDDRRRHVIESLRWQVDNTSDPVTAAVLRAAAEDAERGGPTWDRLAPHAELPPGAAIALRLAGAAHRLALAGEAPEYAAHLPTCGGDGDTKAAAKAFVALMDDDRLDLRPVQTNEPRRTAPLAAAFHVVHQRTGLPLRLLELGASAGLLLRFDDYAYELGSTVAGNASSAVRIRVDLDGPTPAVGPTPVVARRGCDPNPLDPASPEDRLLLLSFVWAGEVERFRTVEAAIDAAAADPAPVDRADAAAWLADHLAPASGTTTVVFHSIVQQYLSPATRSGVNAAITDAATRATADAPLAHITFEPGEGRAETRLTLWPGGEEHLVAVSGFHGSPLDWRGYR